MGTESKPKTRRYTQEQKDQAIRLVRLANAETGQEYGVVQRVARQLGFGVETVRGWVKQADIDAGVTPGVSTVEAARIKQLEQEVKELRRANAILKSASVFSRRSSTARIDDCRIHRRQPSGVRG
jgi:transposase